VPQSSQRRPRMRPNVSEEVSQYIRELIFGGKLRPNQRVPQDEIASELSVSRLPVREALINLQNEGLVYSPARRGAFVAPIENIDVQDHYEIYGLAHGIAAARTATIGDQAAVDELRRLHNAMMNAGDAAAFEDFNWQFHRVINVTGGSSRLKALLATLVRSLPRNLFIDVPGATEVAIAGHAEILSALERGDAQGAALACHLHLRREGESVVRMLAARNFWDDDWAAEVGTGTSHHRIEGTSG
jgi:DNA-binding GntR family transcriptional regulator